MWFVKKQTPLVVAVGATQERAVKAAAKAADISEEAVGQLIRDGEWTLETEWNEVKAEK